MERGGFSDYRANLWLGSFKTAWIGLHFADPTTAGAYASEVFGGSYNRIQATFSDPDARAIFNTGTIKFTGLPSVRITVVSGWSAQYNGNMEFYVPLSTPVNVAAGKTYTIDASQLALSLP